MGRRICSHTCASGSLSYCNSEQVEIGTNKNDCEETCYECRAKTCEEGGFRTSVSSCDNYTTVNFAGKTCYTNITNKTCSDGGYASSVPTNQVGETTNYCSNTCYYNLNYQELQVVICVINVVAQEFASNVIMIFNCYFKEQ